MTEEKVKREKPTKEQWDKAYKMKGEGLGVAEIAKATGLLPGTISNRWAKDKKAGKDIPELDDTNYIREAIEKLKIEREAVNASIIGIDILIQQRDKLDAQIAHLEATPLYS